MSRLDRRFVIVCGIALVGGLSSCQTESEQDTPDPTSEPTAESPDYPSSTDSEKKVPVINTIPPKGKIDESQEVKNMSQVITSENWRIAIKHDREGGGMKVTEEIIEESIEAALHHYGLVAKEQPTNPMPLAAMGDALMNLGRYGEALEVYSKSLELQETFHARYAMAKAFKELKNYPMMVQTLRISVEHEPVLNDMSRFSEQFEDVRGIPEMKEFENQFR